MRILANLGAILGFILEPGGRMGPILDPLKNQTPKRFKMPVISSPYWGSFLDYFGVIFGAFLASIFGPRFWMPFGISTNEVSVRPSVRLTFF